MRGGGARRMLAGLWWKELRALRPFLLLLLLFAAFSLVVVTVGERPDAFGVARWLEAREDGEKFYLLVALAMALGLWVREHDEGTLRFLDGLPVGRTPLFLVKFAAGLAVLWMMPILDTVLGVACHAWSRTSIEARFPWGLFLTGLAIDLFLGFLYLAIGAALSFLRRYAFLVLGLLFWAYIGLKARQVSWIPYADIFGLAQPAFQGARWVVSGPILLVQAVLGGVALGMALAAFHGLGDRTDRAIAWMGGKLGGKRMGGVGKAVIGITWLVLLGYWASQADFGTDGEVKYPAWSAARATTERFQFLYPASQTEAASRVVEQADPIEAQVRAWFGAEPGDVIVADFTGRSLHLAGQAHWNKVQMVLAPGETLTNQLAVFGHELAHVYIDRLSNFRMSEAFNSTRFFHEGLATYVEYELFRVPAERAALRQVAAFAASRLSIRVEDLMDDAEFSRQWDRSLVYALGEVFVAATVGAEGPEAVRGILRAMARADAPQGLKGPTLWQDAFQTSGRNLSDTVARYHALLQREVDTHRVFLDGLPRLRGVVEYRTGRIGVRMSEGAGPGRVATVRFRAEPDAEEEAYEPAFPDGSGIAWVEAQGYPAATFGYQVGWRVPRVPFTLYEQWVEAPRQR